MKSKLFINGRFFAALYSLPQHGGLSVTLFLRYNWRFVDTYYLGSVSEALRFLREDSFRSIKSPTECLPSKFNQISI